MARKLPHVDVVIVGLGWAGSIIAHELASEGLEVVAFERGPWRDTAKDFNIITAADELRYNAREELMVTQNNQVSRLAIILHKRLCLCAIWAHFTQVMVLVGQQAIGLVSHIAFSQKNFA